MSATRPRFSRKETRELAAEAEAAGFVYTGDDTKGHARYEHPTGVTLSLAETPGHGQIKRVRDLIARATGQRRGAFDRTAQRARQAAERDARKAAREAAGARETAAAEARAEQLERSRLDRIARDLADGSIPKSHGKVIASRLSPAHQEYLARAYATALQEWGWRWRRHPDLGAQSAWRNANRAFAS